MSVCNVDTYYPVLSSGISTVTLMRVDGPNVTVDSMINLYCTTIPHQKPPSHQTHPPF